MLGGVPTVFIGMLNHPAFASFDVSRLRKGLIGGAPCPVEVMRRLIDDMGMRDITIVYGMTETSPVSVQTSRDDTLEQRVATVGRVHPHVEVKIVDLGRPHRAARRAGRDLHPRLLGDAGLLERCGGDRGGDRSRALDAHRRSGHDGRRTAMSRSPAAARTW